MSTVTARPVRVEDTFQVLLGMWSVERRITDHRSGQTGTFTGAAVAEERRDEPGTATYEERGELTWGGGGHSGPAERRLLYVRQADGGVEVRFGDGRRAWAWDLGNEGRSDAVHPCGEDRYEMSLVARTADELEERWRVSGPAKEYEAVTVLRRSR
jgi:hypothetical protein